MVPVARPAALPVSVASRPAERRVLPEERAEALEARAVEAQVQGLAASPVREWPVVEPRALQAPLQVRLEPAPGQAATRRVPGGSLAQAQLARVVPVRLERAARAARRVRVVLLSWSSDHRSSRLGRALIGKRGRSR
jgi:hypothetical protein